MPNVEKMNRRHWLGATIAAGAVGAIAGVAGGSPKPAGSSREGAAPKEIIDAHSHVWTDDVATYPLANDQTVDDLAPRTFTPEELWKVCGPHGVQRVVLIQHHIYHGWDNTYLCAMAAADPKRLRVVGMVDDQTPHTDQQMKKLLDSRVTGFRITPWIRGSDVWLSGDGMAAMWRTGAETKQAMCCLIDPSNISQVAEMCRRFPKTPVVIDHFARIGVDGMIHDKDVKALCDLAGHKQVKVKISAYYALGKKRPPYDDLVPMIRRLLDAYGPERLMWASDSPYQLEAPSSYAASLELITERMSQLSSGDLDWLLRRTAAETYFYV